MAMKKFRTLLVKCYEARSRKGVKVVSISYPEELSDYKDDIIQGVTGLDPNNKKLVELVRDLSDLMMAASPTELKYSEDHELFKFNNLNEYIQDKQSKLFEYLKEFGCKPLDKQFEVNNPESKLTVLHQFTIIPRGKDYFIRTDKKLTA